MIFIGAYSKEKILSYISSRELVSGSIDADTQTTPNGFDLSLSLIERLTSAGKVDFSNEQRVISRTEEIPYGEDGWAFLGPGTYKITFNEVVSIPHDAIAIARTRSTLLRCGASIETGVWDAGYKGRSSSMLNVVNPQGIYLKKDARVLQLVFFDLDTTTDGYCGTYQNENMVD